MMSDQLFILDGYKPSLNLMLFIQTIKSIDKREENQGEADQPRAMRLIGFLAFTDTQKVNKC